MVHAIGDIRHKPTTELQLKETIMEQHMEQARMLAAQCWCDEETSGKEMDATLAEAVARKIARLRAINAELVAALNRCKLECTFMTGPLYGDVCELIAKAKEAQS